MGAGIRGAEGEARVTARVDVRMPSADLQETSLALLLWDLLFTSSLG